MTLRDAFLAANPDDGEQLLAEARIRRDANKAVHEECITSAVRTHVEKLAGLVEDMKLNKSSGFDDETFFFAKGKFDELLMTTPIGERE